MKKKSIIITLISILLLSLSSCSNTYMKQDSSKFSKLTSSLLGEWNVLSYYYNGKESINKSFVSANFSLNLDNDTLGSLFFKLIVKEDYYTGTSPFAGIQVDEYSVIQNGSWLLNKDGVKLSFILEKPKLNIKGSGDGFDDWVKEEKSFFVPLGKVKKGNSNIPAGLSSFVSGINVALENESVSIFPALNKINNFRLEKNGKILIIYSADNITIKLEKN